VQASFQILNPVAQPLDLGRRAPHIVAAGWGLGQGWLVQAQGRTEGDGDQDSPHTISLRLHGRVRHRTPGSPAATLPAFP
jgi:hypothetical protein